MLLVLQTIDLEDNEAPVYGPRVVLFLNTCTIRFIISITRPLQVLA